MSQNSFHEISVQKVFDLISNYMKDAHDVLLEVLQNEPNYKHLLITGEKQFFDAPNESSIEQTTNSRKSVTQANNLAIAVDQDIDKIVQEQFQGEILDKLKSEVLQAILKLSSDQVNNSNGSCQAATFPNKTEIDQENTASIQIAKLNNYFIQNNCKQANSNINGRAKSSLAAKLDLDDGDADLSILSFDSVSSVHTSDLSSFEDEISLSSEEEFGDKKRLSLREVQEKLELSKSEIMECTDDNKQGTSIETEDAQSNSLANTSEPSGISQKSQRKRKPNLKYTDDDILLPIKKKADKNTFSSSRSVCGDIPRKRGRPRKYST